jgi:multidrug efflux pump subunit AcrB
MPEGTTLEKTQAVTRDIADYVSWEYMVRNYQDYIGISAPISFKGLVSVGIPTYRRPEMLRRALKIITEQTYKNLEIMIVLLVKF